MKSHLPLTRCTVETMAGGRHYSSLPSSYYLPKRKQPGQPHLHNHHKCCKSNPSPTLQTAPKSMLKSTTSSRSLPRLPHLQLFFLPCSSFRTLLAASRIGQTRDLLASYPRALSCQPKSSKYLHLQKSTHHPHPAAHAIPHGTATLRQFTHGVSLVLSTVSFLLHCFVPCLF